MRPPTGRPPNSDAFSYFGVKESFVPCGTQTAPAVKQTLSKFGALAATCGCAGQSGAQNSTLSSTVSITAAASGNDLRTERTCSQDEAISYTAATVQRNGDRVNEWSECVDQHSRGGLPSISTSSWGLRKLHGHLPSQSSGG